MRWFLLIFVVLLLSCSDDDNNTENTPQPFSMTVNLTDGTGNPLPGYKIGFYPDNLGDFVGSGGRPCVSIKLSVAQDSLRVKLEIQDYFGNHIRELADCKLGAGQHTWAWNGCDDDTVQVQHDGLFKVRAEYFYANQSVFCDSTYAYLLDANNASRLDYSTDQEGSLVLTDMTPFPTLYCEHEVLNTDSQTEVEGPINFVPTFIVLAARVDSTSSEVIECRTATFTVHDGANILNLNWEQMQIDEDDEAPEAVTKPQSTPRTKGIREENKLYPVYPNPFN
jgi:hypothetical protein